MKLILIVLSSIALARCYEYGAPPNTPANLAFNPAIRQPQPPSFVDFHSNVPVEQFKPVVAPNSAFDDAPAVSQAYTIDIKNDHGSPAENHGSFDSSIFGGCTGGSTGSGFGSSGCGPAQGSVSQAFSIDLHHDVTSQPGFVNAPSGVAPSLATGDFISDDFHGDAPKIFPDNVVLEGTFVSKPGSVSSSSQAFTIDLHHDDQVNSNTISGHGFVPSGEAPQLPTGSFVSDEFHSFGGGVGSVSPSSQAFSIDLHHGGNDESQSFVSGHGSFPSGVAPQIFSETAGPAPASSHAFTIDLHHDQGSDKFISGQGFAPSGEAPKLSSSDLIAGRFHGADDNGGSVSTASQAFEIDIRQGDFTGSHGSDNQGEFVSFNSCAGGSASSTGGFGSSGCGPVSSPSHAFNIDLHHDDQSNSVHDFGSFGSAPTLSAGDFHAVGGTAGSVSTASQAFTIDLKHDDQVDVHGDSGIFHGVESGTGAASQAFTIDIHHDDHIESQPFASGHGSVPTGVAPQLFDSGLTSGKLHLTQSTGPASPSSHAFTIDLHHDDGVNSQGFFGHGAAPTGVAPQLFDGGLSPGELHFSQSTGPASSSSHAFTIDLHHDDGVNNQGLFVHGAAPTGIAPTLSAGDLVSGNFHVADGASGLSQAYNIDLHHDGHVESQSFVSGHDFIPSGIAPALSSGDHFSGAFNAIESGAGSGSTASQAYTIDLHHAETAENHGAANQGGFVDSFASGCTGGSSETGYGSGCGSVSSPSHAFSIDLHHDGHEEGSFVTGFDSVPSGVAPSLSSGDLVSGVFHAAQTGPSAASQAYTIDLNHVTPNEVQPFIPSINSPIMAVGGDFVSGHSNGFEINHRENAPSSIPQFIYETPVGPPSPVYGAPYF